MTTPQLITTILKRSSLMLCLLLLAACAGSRPAGADKKQMQAAIWMADGRYSDWLYNLAEYNMPHGHARVKMKVYVQRLNRRYDYDEPIYRRKALRYCKRLNF